MSDIGERILYIRENAASKKMSMATFGKRIGVSPASINQWEKGVTVPPTPNLKVISDEFGISYDWLVNGIGEMYEPKAEDDEIAEIVEEMFHDSDPTRRKLAKFIFSLDEEDMTALKKIWSKMGNVLNEQ